MYHWKHEETCCIGTSLAYTSDVMVLVGVSKLGCTELFFCRAGDENKRCLLPRRAADASYCQSLGRHQGMSSCFSRTCRAPAYRACETTELLRGETPDLFHRKSNHRTVQILTERLEQHWTRRHRRIHRSVACATQSMRAFGWTFWTHAVNLSALTYEQAYNIPGRHLLKLNVIAPYWV